MNIKCIALDLDRTTLNASGRLSDGNYNALCHAIENGVHIVIASGRSFDTLPKDVLAVPGIEYAITSNGAAIYHIPTSTCLHEYKMTPASVECIIQIAKQHETALEVFIDGKAYALKAYVEDPVSYGTTPQEFLLMILFLLFENILIILTVWILLSLASSKSSSFGMNLNIIVMRSILLLLFRS